MTPREANADLLAEIAALRDRLASLIRESAERQEALTQAGHREAATSEILGVISSSPTNLQPVFEAIARSTVRLCEGARSTVWRPEGDLLRCVARWDMTPDGHVVRASSGESVDAESIPGRAIHEGQIVQVNDVPENPAVPPTYRERARIRGYRSLLAVPMVREGVAIGVITVVRPTSTEFTDQQVGLVKTFADQAVIAIENVPLFNETKERLEQQTATAEILRVISRSPTDVQPVFDAIARNSVTLCGGIGAVVLRFDGELLHLAGHHNASVEGVERLERAYPRRPARDYPPGRAFLDRSVVHVPDLQAATEFAASTARHRGAGSQLAVPLLRGQEAIGVITLARNLVGPFSPQQIEVLQTFADQAVIAIENVRLFKELRTSNRDLTEALDQQTATSEILRAISSSPTDLQPVLNTIAINAVRVCGAYDATVLLREGEFVRRVAHHGPLPSGREDLVPINRSFVSNRTILDSKPVHLQDVLAPEGSDFSDSRESAQRAGFRTMLSVPLLHEGSAIGALNIRRREVRPFSDSQVTLLQTFADQAVIAIENVRLFTELQASNKDLREALDTQTATSDILRVISKSPTDLQPVFDPLLDSAVRLCGATHASLYRLDGDVLHHVAARGSIQGPRPVGMKGPIPHGTAPGRAILTGETVQVMDAQEEVAGMPPDAREYVLREGVRTVLAVPLLREGSPIGVIVVRRTEVRPFAESEMRLLMTFADQAVIAIENVRLFKELEVANRELAAASQHKSEFLANMSHELRTPLNAIIGFSEVLSERMFGDLNEKQEEYLKDIYASGTHLLSLINDILDLSKIEAGRMELELTDFHLPTALDSALTLVRERAGRRAIALHTNIDGQLGEIRADERKIRQVVLNLLSNAIKFTPEGGRIDVAAVQRDASVEVSVSDTGVGIASEDQEAVFEEFRQVGTADRKAEGTGLGLTLCRKFIELHGGRIWAKSQVGVGSTFTFTIPVARDG